MIASVNTGKAQLTVDRAMSWGNKGVTYFETKDYPALKKAFDRIHECDTHTLTLKAK